MRIGSFTISPAVVLAPMAGVTDRPFRQLCRRLGAGMAASEMVSADPRLRHTRKTRLRMDHSGEPDPVVVQIAGYDPAMMADAARYNVDHGARIIDINMGCPAKKVCNVMAGSALLRDEPLVAAILDSVVRAVDVPVTLKIRTGWDRERRNAVTIARLAQAAGIQAVAVHGRTRADAYQGQAEYDTVRAVRDAVTIPLMVNGDITSPQIARKVLDHTGADAVMIGRAAQGRPWIFRQVAHHLATGTILPEPEHHEVGEILLGHMQALYGFYGEPQGVRVARKHLAWYCNGRQGGGYFRAAINRAETADEQIALARAFFDRHNQHEDCLAA